jgi:hypothetical protein
MVGSMGDVGAAGDNAAMESFFSLLQKNVLNRRGWDTREELSRSSPGISAPTTVARQAALGRLTPIEYEAIMTAPASQAAWRNCHLSVQQTHHECSVWRDTQTFSPTFEIDIASLVTANTAWYRCSATPNPLIT